MTECQTNRYNCLHSPDIRAKEFLDSNSPLLENFGLTTEHHPKTQDIFKFLNTLDFVLGDYFCWKSGGDGDNGELFMAELDAYFAMTEKRNDNYKK